MMDGTTLPIVIGAGSGRLLTVAQLAEIPEEDIWRAQQKSATPPMTSPTARRVTRTASWPSQPDQGRKFLPSGLRVASLVIVERQRISVPSRCPV
jgi:hypothetical protein